MYKFLRLPIGYDLSLLVDLVMRSDVKEDYLVFKLYVDNTDITRYRERASALKVTSQHMIVDRSITMSGDKHIYTFSILLAKLFILSDTLRITFDERVVELNALHVGDIPSCS